MNINNSDDDNIDILEYYVKQINWVGLNIEQSLRGYFNELRLTSVVDQNKENTLFEAVANEYIESNQANPMFYGDNEDCMKIYSQCTMLNRSLHSKIAVGRSRITEKQFIDTMKQQIKHDIKDFEDTHIISLYNSILKTPLEEVRNYSRPSNTSKHNININAVNNDDNNDDDDDDDKMTPKPSGNCCTIL